MKHFWLPALFCALFAVSAPSRADFAAGLKAYEAGDFTTAMRAWLPLAEAGDAEAQFRVGRMFDVGEGMAVNAKKAVFWYGKAATAGHAKAAYNLGIRYHDGDGVEKSEETAAKLFAIGANGNIPKAQLNLGLLYVGGKGVPRDYVQAYKWFFIAAASGLEPAGEALEYFRQVVPAESIESGRQLADQWRSGRPRQ